MRVTFVCPRSLMVKLPAFNGMTTGSVPVGGTNLKEEVMTTNEIKKDLYRNKPMATLTQKSGGYLYYVSELSTKEKIEFNVPEKEAEGFGKLMEAQLLIRWLT